MLKKVLQIIIFSLIFGCGILLDPIQNEYSNSKSNQISRKEAVQRVRESLVVLTNRCPKFTQSKFNYTTGYFFQIFNDTCQENYDPLKGCASQDYLNRSHVQLCVLAVQGDPCLSDVTDPNKKETRFSSSFAVTFAICASAFQKVPVNLIFF